MPSTGAFGFHAFPIFFVFPAFDFPAFGDLNIAHVSFEIPACVLLKITHVVYALGCVYMRYSCS